MTDNNEIPDIEPIPDAGSVESVKSPTLVREVRNNFLSGVFVALPIGLTIWIIAKFVLFVDVIFKPIIPAVINPDTYLPIKIPNGPTIDHIPGVGLIVAFILLFILGTLAKNFFGRTLLSIGERILARVPFVGAIYNFIKQIVGVVAERQDATFTEVCMLEYPLKGAWAVAFITSDVQGEPAKVLPKGFVNVFVPTTPNPTSGFLLMVERKNLKILDMTPEEGAKLIISAGMVTEEKRGADVKGKRAVKRISS